MCAGLEAGIQEATHAVRQRRVERVLSQRGDMEGEAEEEEDPEEERAEVAACSNILPIKTAGTEVEGIGRVGSGALDVGGGGQGKRGRGRGWRDSLGTGSP